MWPGQPSGIGSGPRASPGEGKRLGCGDMAERSPDWLRQAEKDLEKAKLEPG